MSPILLSIVLIFTTLATAFLSGLIGMAGGIILMGVLLLLLPVAQAMVLHGFVQLVSNGWRAWLWRKYIHWRIVRHSFVGAVGALNRAIPLTHFSFSDADHRRHGWKFSCSQAA